MSKHSAQAEKQVTRRMKILLIVLSILTATILLFVGILGTFAFSLLSKVQEDGGTSLTYEEQLNLAAQLLIQSQDDPEELKGLDEAGEVGTPNIEPAEIVPGIYNYLLLGMDTRDPNNLDAGLTDVNILVTLDTVNEKIKLTSIMRDTLVNIEGHGQNRINAINALHGPEAMVKFVENYTGLKIEGYVKVNFSCVTSIINIIGGVDMKLSSAEVNVINQYLVHLNDVDTLNPREESLKNVGDGVYHLTGKQAVSYMRIRKNMGGEFGRNQRQRKLLNEVVVEMRDITFTEALQLMSQITNYMKTNLNSAEILNAVSMLFNLRNAPMEQMSMPSQDKYKSAQCKGMYVLVVDFEEQAQRVQRFILQDLPPDAENK